MPMRTERDRPSGGGRPRRAWVLAVAVGLAGCGAKGPVVHVVAGTVTVDGKPVEAAIVGFSPVVPGEGLAASGVTGPDGAFRLTATRGGRAGAGTAVGEYVVTVSKDSVEPVSPPQEGDPNYGKSPGRMPTITQEVDGRFGDPATSPLRATVQPGFNGGEAFRFDVRSSRGAAAGR